VRVIWYLFRSYLNLRRIRKRLDALATALGAEASWRIDDGSSIQLYYRFSDGNWVTITVAPIGGNVYTPSWTPGYEKDTPGLDLLLMAANKACRVPGHT
jgi:hypothetical protein